MVHRETRWLLSVGFLLEVVGFIVGRFSLALCGALLSVSILLSGVGLVGLWADIEYMKAAKQRRPKGGAP
jgi:hypothetical protein